MASALTGQAAAARPAWRTLAWIALAAAALGVVAVVNGFPLVFPDTGTYLRQAVKLEGSLDRPPFYSLFVLPLHMTVSLWPIPFVQDAIACYVVFRAFSIAFPELTPPRLAFAVALAGALTSLPWFSNQIMPDIFTPLILLLVFMLCLDWDRLARAERVVMPLMLLAMVAFHQANTVFTLVLLAAALLLAAGRRARGQPRPALLRSTLLVAVPVALAVLGQALYGYVVIRRFTPSPAAPFFALARLLDDGPARRYLAASCPAAGYTLCQYQDAIRGDNNAFLWGADSPLQALIREKREAGALNEASAIVSGTVRAYPGAVLLHAAENAAGQLLHAATTDTDCPCLGGKVARVIAEIFPREQAAYANSLQNRGLLPWLALTVLDNVVLGASLAFLAAVVVVQRRALAGDAGRLLVLIAWGCVANAALMGALSGIADRYEARIAWLVPFFAFALLLSRRLVLIGPTATGRRAPGSR